VGRGAFAAGLTPAQRPRTVRCLTGPGVRACPRSSPFPPRFGRRPRTILPFPSSRTARIGCAPAPAYAPDIDGKGQMFHSAPAPTQEDVEQLALRVSKRILRPGIGSVVDAGGFIGHPGLRCAEGKWALETYAPPGNRRARMVHVPSLTVGEASQVSTCSVRSSTLPLATRASTAGAYGVVAPSSMGRATSRRLPPRPPLPTPHPGPSSTRSFIVRS
jgi:hypothetical protein